jgi:hypothetical protein
MERMGRRRTGRIWRDQEAADEGVVLKQRGGGGHNED